MFKAVAILALSLATAANAADEFRYEVFRSKLLRDEPGQLVISNMGVSYRSDNKKTKIQIRLVDLFKADLSDPKTIRLETYDILKRRLTGRRIYTFRLREGKHDEPLARFLTDFIQRPVIGAFGTAPQPDFQVLAYHRHRLGGCHGKLQIGPGGIRFASDKPEDSRTWLYRDIDSIGSMTPLHFRVSTLAETYNFDLKERLSEAGYEYAWHRVYELADREPVQDALPRR